MAAGSPFATRVCMQQLSTQTSLNAYHLALRMSMQRDGKGFCSPTYVPTRRDLPGPVASEAVFAELSQELPQ